MATFVGIDAQTITNPDGTITEPTATLIFTARTVPGGAYDRDLAVAFDIDKFCETRLTGGIDKNGNPSTLSWYSHWRIDATGQVVHTRKDGSTRDNAGPSVASIFQLSHLEQQGLRESQAYIDAVNSSAKFTDAQKAKLTKFAASHGSTREAGTQTVSQKTERILETLTAHGAIIVDSHLTASEKAELATTIEQAAQAIVETCREPLAAEQAAQEERNKLVAELDDATTVLQGILAKDMKETNKDVMFAAMQRKETALTQLAEFDAAQAQPEPEPASEEQAETDPAETATAEEQTETQVA